MKFAHFGDTQRDGDGNLNRMALNKFMSFAHILRPDTIHTIVILFSLLLAGDDASDADAMVISTVQNATTIA